MPSVKGKGNGGDMRAAAARNGKQVGRPPQFMRVRIRPDTVWIEVPVDTAAQAQRLMLYNWPGVATVEDLVAYAIRRLAESADVAQKD